MAWLGRYLLWVKGQRGGLERPTDLLWRGATLFLVGCVVVALCVSVVQWVLTLLPLWLSLLLTALLLKPSLSLAALTRAGDEVRSALERNDLEGARYALSYHLVSRDVSELSEGEVAGAAVESLAENLSDSVVAPLLFFALFGLVGAWVYRFANTADAVLGYRTGTLEHFGRAAARTDDLLNLVPARLSALLLLLTARLVGARGKRAWATAWRDAGRTPSPNAGWPMAAAAGSLGIKLDKRGAYTLNPDGGIPTSSDISTTTRWISLSSLAAALLLGGGRALWTYA